MTFVVRLLWFVAFLLQPLCIDLADSEASLLQQRKAFLQAERYIQLHRDDDYLVLAASLKDYPLYPYLHYQWLSEHLQDQAAVQQFLRDHAQSRYASLLNDKWLKHLGQSRDWARFLDHYKASDDETLQCYWLMALFQQNQALVAEPKARELWLTGKTLPVACETGFLQALPELFHADRNLLWQRFRNALMRDNQALLDTLLRDMNDDESRRATVWLKVHRQPDRVAEPAEWKRTDAEAGLLFAHAIERWVGESPFEAMRVWDEEQAGFLMPPSRRSEVERALALALAVRHDARAYDRLGGLATKDVVSREWRVRVALLTQDWGKVMIGIDDLEPEQRQQDKWRYWQARALAATNQQPTANQLFVEIAKERSLYGFLSADRVGAAIDWHDQFVTVDSHDVVLFQAREEFQVFAELKALQRGTEAKRQWRHAVSQLSHSELILAAKLAQYWQTPALAISTIAKAGVWNDLSLRYPLHHLDAVEDQGRQRHIEPAVILGLIRQESGFDATAESTVGAKGLMQLMPATAHEIASQEKRAWSDQTQLFEPSLNIQLGSAYLEKLLKRFDGRYLPAIASYNAGPNRVKQWLGFEKDAVPGDIWLETIPYKETRNYVSAVITNSLIYQQRLLVDGSKASDLLMELRPKQN